MKQLISAHPKELAGVGRSSGFTDLAGGKTWLRAELEANKIQGTEHWLQQYESLVPQAALRTAADDLQSILNDKLKFQLIPDPYPTPWYNYWTPSWLGPDGHNCVWRSDWYARWFSEAPNIARHGDADLRTM